MDSESEKKLLFLKIVLEEHGKYLEGLYKKTIEEKNIKKSGELGSSVKTRITGTYENPKLTVDFYTYGRFLEISYFRNRRKNYEALKTPSTNQIVWGVRNSKAKAPKRKDVMWYTRNTYGSLNFLIARLMFEYGDEIINESKSIFKRAYDNQNQF